MAQFTHRIGGNAVLGEFSLTYIDLQIEVGHGKKAIAIFVPVPLLQGFHKIQQRYVWRNYRTQKNWQDTN